MARTVFSSGTGDQKRKSHSEVQEKVNLLWANAKLFDKGIKLFSGKPEFSAVSWGIPPVLSFCPYFLYLLFSARKIRITAVLERLSDRNTSDLTATVLPREDSQQFER